jgi:formyltetrahydrofolate deformylase
MKVETLSENAATGEYLDEVVLAVSCPNRVGIVHAVSGFFAEREGDILESQQFDDEVSDRFLRIQVRFPPESRTLRDLRHDFGALASEFDMSWKLTDVRTKQRVLIMVSKFGHCLNDLLYRWHSGQLRIDIPVIVSNHEDMRPLAERHGIPYIHIPVTPDTKPAAERKLLEVVKDFDVDLIVLARYMQILSDELSRELEGRAINIHHSFLPSFKGGRPYHQAHARGVKLAGATAHYVTADLDEGPIIEQEVVRVHHDFSPEQMVVAGRDAECLALARAVQWHTEDRILLNGHRTVVFR